MHLYWDRRRKLLIQTWNSFVKLWTTFLSSWNRLFTVKFHWNNRFENETMLMRKTIARRFFLLFSTPLNYFAQMKFLTLILSINYAQSFDQWSAPNTHFQRQFFHRWEIFTRMFTCLFFRCRRISEINMRIERVESWNSFLNVISIELGRFSLIFKSTNYHWLHRDVPIPDQRTIVVRIE